MRFHLTTKKKSDTESESERVRHGGENIQDSRDLTHTGESSLLTENVETDVIYVGSSNRE